LIKIKGARDDKKKHEAEIQGIIDNWKIDEVEKNEKIKLPKSLSGSNSSDSDSSSSYDDKRSSHDSNSTGEFYLPYIKEVEMED